MGTPAGSSRSTTPSAPSSQAQAGRCPPSQAGNSAASHSSRRNSSSSAPPANHQRPSDSGASGSSNVASSASGTTRKPTQGTASRLASGPLTLTGKASASSTGSKPSAAAHWARPRLRHQGQAPSRPANTSSSTATAA